MAFPDHGLEAVMLRLDEPGTDQPLRLAALQQLAQHHQCKASVSNTLQGIADGGSHRNMSFYDSRYVAEGSGTLSGSTLFPGRTDYRTGVSTTAIVKDALCWTHVFFHASSEDPLHRPCSVRYGWVVSVGQHQLECR